MLIFWVPKQSRPHGMPAILAPPAHTSRRPTPQFGVAKGRWCGLTFYQALTAADKAMVIMMPIAAEALELVWRSQDMADEGSRQSYPQLPHVYVESTHVAS